MQAHAKSGRIAVVEARPLSELLECPPETGKLLTGAAQTVQFEAGASVFRQNDDCCGLYLVVSGEFLRKTERLSMRLTLGPAKPGDLVELAAALGDKRHTYTLTALTPGTLLLLPIGALQQAFDRHPPLRMQLLQELAREVSRAYLTCCVTRTLPVRHRNIGQGN